MRATEQSMDIQAIWGEYHSSLKAYLYSRISDRDDAEDVLQEILIKSYNNLGTLNEHTKVKSWLFQIATNAITDFYRKKGRIQELSGEELWYREESEKIRLELAQCVRPFINSLPEPTAKLLTAIEIDGKSQKELAGETGIPYSTLKSRVKKGREELKKSFERCCSFSLDARGQLMEYSSKTGKCGNCD